MSLDSEQQGHDSWPKNLKGTLTLLYVLVFISIGLNIFLIWQLFLARQQAIQTLQQFEQMLAESVTHVDAELQNFQQSSLTFEIRVNQQFPIRTEIPFKRGFEIPVRVDIPIKEEIETTVMMDPFQSGFRIPVEVVVPIDMVFPIDQVVPVTIEEPIPISTTLPLSTTVPININVSDTNLGPYIEQIRTSLKDFDQTLGQALPKVE